MRNVIRIISCVILGVEVSQSLEEGTYEGLAGGEG